MNSLYQASRDDDLAENFHKCCDNIANNLWVERMGYKCNNNVFIFSFDNKEIYYDFDKTKSIKDYINFGPSFEGGWDFRIYFGCMNKNDSYYYSLSTHDTKGKITD